EAVRGAAQLRALRRVQRAPEGGPSLHEQHRLESRGRRRRALGAAAPGVQRRGVGRARRLRRADVRAAACDQDMGRRARRAPVRGPRRVEGGARMSRVDAGNPFAVHEGAAETWGFIERNVLESGLVDSALKELCFAYVADPDSIDLDRYGGGERAALDWVYAIVWDADASTDELWTRLHEHFTEPELVELGRARGVELGPPHLLRALGAD